jgi:hypothetical protein
MQRPSEKRLDIVRVIWQYRGKIKVEVCLMYHYVKETGGRWLLMGDMEVKRVESTVMAAYDRLGVYYSVCNGGKWAVLHKIGEYGAVKAKMETDKELYKQKGFLEVADELRFVDVSGASAEGVNKVLSTSALSEAKFLEFLGKVIEVQDEPDQGK